MAPLLIPARGEAVRLEALQTLLAQLGLPIARIDDLDHFGKPIAAD